MHNLDSKYRDFLDPVLIEKLEILDGLPDQNSIFQQILAWTNGQVELTEYVCNLVVEYSLQNQADIDQELTNKIIQNHLTIDLLESTQPKDLSIFRLLQKIEDTLTRKDLDFDLLTTYKEILWSGRQKNYTNSLEQNQLIKVGVATVDSNEKIVVANLIYKQIFDLNWVDRQIEARADHQTLDKYHLALITGLISILLFSLFQGFMRYASYTRLIQCRGHEAYKVAIDANISLDEQRIEQSIQNLKDLQAENKLVKDCESILYDLQYSQAIYISAGIKNNPMRAVEALCEIPQAYYEERNIQPWFTRWKSLYRKTTFTQDLNQYLQTRNCLASDLLSRSQ